MNLWQELLGHDAQVDMFRRALSNKRLAHAYLFIGATGIGKRKFATMLAQCLFCNSVPDDELNACGECSSCKQVVAGSHPDLLTVSKPQGKKELPIDLLVGAADRRGKEGLCHDLALRPMSANRRVAIIDDANTMNEASSNALLKTLEEPPPGSVIILLTPEIDSILTTIRSRCQPIRFSSLSDDHLANLLQRDPEADAATVSRILPYAGGSLATAKELLDTSLDQLREVVEKTLVRRPYDPIKSKQLLNGVLEELGGDPATQRQYLHWLVQFSIGSLQQQLRELGDVEEVGALMERCFRAEEHLRQSMPVALCLEALCDDMGYLSRQQYV